MQFYIRDYLDRCMTPYFSIMEFIMYFRFYCMSHTTFSIENFIDILQCILGSENNRARKGWLKYDV